MPNSINELKKQIVLAAYNAGEGHIPSAFSILDILWVLHKHILGPNDRFILGKGHGSLALYAVLGLDLTSFGQYDSFLGGHPDRNHVKSILASTGSLGHGLPMAVGVALAKKIKNAPGRSYCVVGDGEMNEGACWEALLTAAHHKLDNLTIIMDNNASSVLNLDSLVEKLKAFNLNVMLANGHNQYEILEILKKVSSNRPAAIVAYTTKGRGVKRMENAPEWHHKVPNAQELSEIMEELSVSSS